MTTYVGGAQVKSGYYLDPSKLAFANVEKDGGTLPGGADARWKRVPLALVVAAAPVLGGLLVITFPLLGFGVAAYALGRKISSRARAGAQEIAATVAPGWAPGEAHLTGKPPEEHATKAAPAKDESVDRLEKEIGERRRES